MRRSAVQQFSLSDLQRMESLAGDASLQVALRQFGAGFEGTFRDTESG